MADIKAGFRAIDGKLIVVAIVTGIALTIGSLIARRAVKQATTEVQLVEGDDNG